MPTITKATPLAGASPITEQQVVTAIMATNPKRPEFTRSVVQRVYRKCAAIDLRGDVWVADAALETGNFASAIYEQFGNIGGLGVFDDGTNVGGTFADPEIAASAFVAHAMAYVYGRALLAGEGWIRYDPRWQAAIDRVARLGTIDTVGGLGNGNWATNPNHADALVSRYNSLFRSIPITPPKEQPPVTDTIVFGKVPHPAYQNRPITKQPGRGMDNLGKRSVKGVVWHRILGYLNSTDTYFRRSDVNALTDYGIGVAAADGAALDGTIYRWNDPLGYQSGWASGRVIAPYGDGAKFVSKYGVNAVNRDQASIEISGFYQTAVSDAAKRAIAGITAYWADQARIPWDQFPINPVDGFSFVRWHNEFTGMAEKECPGGVVMTATSELIGMVKGILKQYQTAGVQPEPEPIPVSPYPKGMSPELARELYGSVSVSWASEPFTFDINRSECRFWLEYGSQDIPEGGDWSQGNWGELTRVIRRGNRGSAGRVYRWSNGAIYFQEPPEKQHGPDETP